MTKAISRSDKLIAAMHYAALRALAEAPLGTLHRNEIFKAIEDQVPLDEWALERYETGVVRWRSIFGFASVGLIKGGYITKDQALWAITPEGRQIVESPYDGQRFLKEVNHRYSQWKSNQIASEAEITIPKIEYAEVDLPTEAPEERMARTINSAHQTLAAELIEMLKKSDPAFFERLVVQLLLRMGYGGSRQEAGQAVGQSGDGGVDGIISEDRLGLDAIYLQAKRWDGSVGEGPIRDFFGALSIKGVRKGVLITTSTFTPAAKRAVDENRSDKKIVLIDGARLAELMIEHDLGVSVSASYQLKRLDSDFFSDA